MATTMFYLVAVLMALLGMAFTFLIHDEDAASTMVQARETRVREPAMAH